MNRRNTTTMSPEIAAALRLPTARAASFARWFPALDRRDRRFVGTSVVSRWRISLPFDDRLRLG